MGEKNIKGVSSMPASIYLLSLCQALMMSSSTLMIAASALVGLQLAENQALATLPLSLQFVAMMFTSIPASFMMGRYGRRAGFMFASLIGVAGGAVIVYSILHHSFWGFSAGAMCIGIFNGFGNYFRFAAVDMSAEPLKSRAISYVLAGGVIAAFIGPNLANAGRGIFPDAEFAGGFLFIIVFYLLVMFVMFIIDLPPAVKPGTRNESRALSTIARQPAFIVAMICGMLGYGVMAFLMTATPLAMKHHQYAFNETAFVIQWHVFAMFAPSFFTGDLISRLGVLTIMLTGVFFAAACVVINLTGVTVTHFWLALMLLGLSWNFLFIGATQLLTESYRPEEKFKAQATNDFLVFSAVTLASLSAGVLQHHFGWRLVNLGVLPLIGIMLISLLWLMRMPAEKRLGPAKPERASIQ